ncbi:unnamed protein product [Gadus morhua 'NCC']
MEIVCRPPLPGTANPLSPPGAPLDRGPLDPDLPSVAPLGCCGSPGCDDGALNAQRYCGPSTVAPLLWPWYCGPSTVAPLLRPLYCGPSTDALVLWPLYCCPTIEALHGVKEAFFSLCQLSAGEEGWRRGVVQRQGGGPGCSWPRTAPPSVHHRVLARPDPSAPTRGLHRERLRALGSS